MYKIPVVSPEEQFVCTAVSECKLHFFGRWVRVLWKIQIFFAWNTRRCIYTKKQNKTKQNKTRNAKIETKSGSQHLVVVVFFLWFCRAKSSSSICCGAGDHKVSPCTTIISKCGNLLFLHCSFIIPNQSLYIGKVWSTWSIRSPFASGWDYRAYLLAGSSFDIWRMWPRNFSWLCLTRSLRGTVLVME